VREREEERERRERGEREKRGEIYIERQRESRPATVSRYPRHLPEVEDHVLQA
jgi:hypothetical protein